MLTGEKMRGDELGEIEKHCTRSSRICSSDELYKDGDDDDSKLVSDVPSQSLVNINISAQHIDQRL